MAAQPSAQEASKGGGEKERRRQETSVHWTRDKVLWAAAIAN